MFGVDPLQRIDELVGQSSYMRLKKDVIVIAFDLLDVQFAANEVPPAIGRIGILQVRTMRAEQHGRTWVGRRRIGSDGPDKCLGSDFRG